MPNRVGIDLLTGSDNNPEINRISGSMHDFVPPGFGVLEPGYGFFIMGEVERGTRPVMEMLVREVHDVVYGHDPHRLDGI